MLRTVPGEGLSQLQKQSLAVLGGCGWACIYYKELADVMVEAENLRPRKASGVGSSQV